MLPQEESFNKIGNTRGDNTPRGSLSLTQTRVFPIDPFPVLQEGRGQVSQRPVNVKYMKRLFDVDKGFATVPRGTKSGLPDYIRIC